MSYQFDHRQLADEMEIYFLDEQIGAGLPVWLPNGVAIREALEKFIKSREQKAGFQRVVSPHIAKSEIYEISGHLKAFAENMYPPMKWPDENSEFYLRPMNCPHHHKIFASSLRSYRQLPLRLAEYGQVYRFENSGSLKGLSRVRGLCQNDAHIYLDPKDCSSEIIKILEMHEECYRVLGLKNYKYRLSKCDPDNLKEFDGPLDLWIKSEEILRQSLKQMNLEFFEASGEAAFYGPKIDIQMRLGSQEESIASVQIDFNSAEKFDLKFVSSSGENIRPWIIHRAPLGSHERFIAMLLEYYDGQLPAWLAPIQVCIIPVSEKFEEQAHELSKQLQAEHIRVHVDQSSGSLSKRLLFCHRYRPFVKIILGKKEIESKNLVLQMRNAEKEIHLDHISPYLNAIFASPG